MTLCYLLLGLSTATMCAVLFMRPFYHAVTAVWDRTSRVNRVAFVTVCLFAALYGGAKHATGKITYPRTDPTLAYLTDKGSYVTNDFVHIDFDRLSVVPSSAMFYLDSCGLAETNAQGVATNWVNAKTATFGELSVPFDFAFANATNYNWLAYTDWTPGPAVQTNGVWHAYWGVDKKTGSYFIPVRTCVRDGSEVIATPKSKGPAGLLGYVTDGLVCFYDRSDSDGEICDTNFLLKAEGTNSYEVAYTAEFCLTKHTDNRWCRINWNTSDYPFLPRPDDSSYPPNAYSNGKGIDYSGLPYTTGRALNVSVVTDGNGKRDYYWLGEFGATRKQILRITLPRAIYPRTLSRHSDSEVTVHCYRLYNRSLTAEEVAHNYAVDKARFGTTL